MVVFNVIVAIIILMLLVLAIAFGVAAGYSTGKAQTYEQVFANFVKLFCPCCVEVLEEKPAEDSGNAPPDPAPGNDDNKNGDE